MELEIYVNGILAFRDNSAECKCSLICGDTVLLKAIGDNKNIILVKVLEATYDNSVLCVGMAPSNVKCSLITVTEMDKQYAELKQKIILINI